MNKPKFFAAFSALLICVASLCSCSSNKSRNVVVIRAGETTITRLYFSDAYSNNAHREEYAEGSISDEEYFELIVSDLTRLAVTVEAARNSGLTLSDDEKQLIDSNARWYLDSLLYSYYPTPGPEPISSEKKHEYALNALNASLRKSGYTSDDYVDYYSARREYELLSSKFYDYVTENVVLDTSDIEAFIEQKAEEQSSMSIVDFAARYDSFRMGLADLPLYSPEDCFSVNYIFIEYSGSDDANGGAIYDSAPAADREEQLDTLLSENISMARFNELIGEFGDDPDMGTETGIEWGMLVSPGILERYPEEFGYAAMNLMYDGWTPDTAQAGGRFPRLTFFSLADGERVAKVAAESGIYYIVVNKSFKRGVLEYEYGGEVWNAAYEAAYRVECDAAFDKAYSDAMARTEVEVFYNRFKSEYMD